MQMFFLLFLFSVVDCRWAKPNIYNWLEQNSYICYLELKSPHDLRFLNKEEASILKCSCGDPLLTQSACARSNNLRRPFCARLPDLCMKAYTIIFTPSNSKKTKNENSTIENRGNAKGIAQNVVQDYTSRASTRFEFFTLAPKVEVPTGPGKKEVEKKPIRGLSLTSQATSVPSTAGKPSHLLDGEVTAPHDHHGIEILLNNTHTMDKIMSSLIRKIAESVNPNSAILPKKQEKGHMIKMLSSHEEEAPIQRVIFTETMREDNSTAGEETVTIEPLILRPDGVAIDEATSSPSLSSSSLPSSTTLRLKIPKTKNSKKRPVYHEALVKLQKQLLKVWGVKPDDWDYEDEINDNDIITIFRERMDDENDLAFSDDKWSEESQEDAKDIPFDPRICEDNHSFCSIWTAYRLCHPHARFMYKYCRKSCGICL